MIVNPMDNIGSYITTQGASILSRDGNYPTAYNATIPLGINPQPLYIQNPASVTTGHHQFASPHNFSLVPQNSLPTPIHIKTRVYVPNQIVGILIGTKVIFIFYYGFERKDPYHSIPLDVLSLTVHIFSGDACRPGYGSP